MEFWKGFLEELINLGEKAQEKAVIRAEKQAQRMAQQAQEIETYKCEYAYMEDTDMIDTFNSLDDPLQKRAIQLLLNERLENYIQEYKFYPEYLLNQELHKQKSPVRRKAIVTLLKEKGYR